MTTPKNEEKIQAEKCAPRKRDEKPGDKKEAERMSAADYIERALADPGFGDSRRDELALAALKFAARFRVRPADPA